MATAPLPQTFTVSGHIYDIFNTVISGAVVQAYEKDLRRETLLGSATSNAQGFYTISFGSQQSDISEYKNPDVFIRVTGSNQSLLGQSAISFNIEPQATIDFKAGNTEIRPMNEYEALLQLLQPLVTAGNLQFKDLVEDDIHFLAGDTEADEANITSLVKAHQLSDAAAQLSASSQPPSQNTIVLPLVLPIPPAFFYAWLRLGFAGELDELLHIQSESLRKTLLQAVEENIVSGSLASMLEEVLAVLNTLLAHAISSGADAANEKFTKTISTVLPTADLQKTFVETYLANEATPKFWEQLALQPGFTDTNVVENTKHVFRLNRLTGGETGLTALLYNESQTDNELKVLSGFAKFTRDDWKNRITQTINNNSFTDFPAWVKGETQDEKIEDYASSINQLTGLLFPTPVFAKRLSADANGSFENRNDLITFFSKNPEFDLQTNTIKTLFEAADFDGVNEENVKADLIKINRLSKLSPSPDYEAVSALSAEGLDSATGIVQKYSASQFNEKFASVISVEKATAIYRNALQIDKRSVAIAVGMQMSNDISVYAINGDNGVSPDYQSMFGDNMLCDCEHCASVYSPAAYLVDILRFMEWNNHAAFDALKRRRPDIEKILLTCKNTNTPLPYIDLVNEILEDKIAGVTSAYQTNNTAEELAAYPEHTNKAAYVLLRNANSSFNLPLNLSLEETRIFLDKAGIKRVDLMETFFGKKAANKYNDIAIAAEYLQLSKEELEIINGTTPVSPPPMNRVSEFLQSTGLTYIELLQLLDSCFINPRVDPLNPESDRTINIVAAPGEDATTCDIDKLILSGATTANKVYPFLRLWKKIQWDMLDIDRVFTALDITAWDMSPQEINTKLIIPLSHVARIKTAYNLSVPQILTLWSAIDTAVYYDHTKESQPEIQSLYQKLFQNKQVTNPVDDAFINADALSGTLSEKAKIIIAALNISQQDFDVLSKSPYTDGSLSLANLSLLFRYATLARAMHITISDLISFIDITGVNPFGNIERTEETLAFSDKVSLIRSSGFSFSELAVLLGKSTGAVQQPDIKSISELLNSLREGLKKINFLFPVPEGPTAEEEAVIRQTKLANQNQFISDTLSTAFKTESKLATVLINDLVKSTADNTQPAITPFIDDAFINSEGALYSISELNEVSWAFPDLIATYNRLSQTWNRVSVLISKFKIAADEFIYLQKKEAALHITGIWNLPADVSGTDLYPAFENLYNIIRFRNALINRTPDWYQLFHNAITVIDDSKKNFIAYLIELAGLSKATVEFLLGAETDADEKGALNFTFPDDYLDGACLLNVINCAQAEAKLGNTVNNIFELTKHDVSDNDAQLAKAILKSRYDEIAWLDIIKPISNQLREKKREALVSYILTAPELEENFRHHDGNNITNTNSLFQYFLIDVEMDACMVTSRIKQAISSVQLFIDRCLMNLETGILLGNEFASQWNESRKQIGVWEANRKIFLYPENWMEPELRDDKSSFFKELESKLRQNDVTDETAKDALLGYLEKLDTVADLEMVGLFPDEGARIVHVIGRTRNLPHLYFYRKKERNVWSAWEKMDVDIEGDHILPVVWNHRLFVFWGMFTEKQDNSDNTTNISNPSTEGPLSMTTPQPTTYLEIKLAWSECKNGKWGGKKTSRDAYPIYLCSNSKYISLDSKYYNDKLAIGLNLSFYNEEDLIEIYIKQNLMNYEFDQCNSAPKIKTSTPPNDILYIPARTLPRKMKIESLNIEAFSIFTNGFYTKDFPAEETVLLANIENFEILPKHHEIEKTKPVSFFYSDDRNNFYAYTIEKLNPKPDNDLIYASDISITRITIDNFGNGRQPSANGSDLQTTFSSGPAAPPDVEVDSTLENTRPETVFTGKQYVFQTFYHPYVCDFIRILNSQGIDGLYKEAIQNVSPKEIFTATDYNPDAIVKKPWPVEEIDFNFTGSYSIYNWELFFHIPLLIATRLSENQKFEEARKWFHYIFDPTKSSSSATGAERFWITQPFKKEIENGLLTINDLINDPDYADNLRVQLYNWENNPFKPYSVARFRYSACMRNTVMKYMDNLIAWGDNLFQRDTIESINEATLLYVLAANMLGKKPEQIPARAVPEENSYSTIENVLDRFGNAKVQIQSFLSPNEANGETTDDQLLMPLFCTPKNDILLGYWDTVADRLFKIRHCMNIEGVVRQLPLFEPPIDPRFLVRAAAAGIDLNTILNEMTSTLPNYRFQVMLQKANELCNDVKGLGSELLSALEKRDAEQLALLRSTHELNMLSMIRDIKEKQRDEAEENLNSLLVSRSVIEERLSYYNKNASSYLNASEKSYFDLTQTAIGIQEILEIKNYLASGLIMTPDTKIGSGFTIGSTFGGSNLAGSLAFASNALQSIASLSRLQAETANMKGGYDRRMDEWNFQAKSATLELKQIDKQILAAEIRLAIAEKDLENHDLQMEQSQEVDDYMRSKFTNAELYDWMVGQISTVYFQSYQLAYNTAKKAEKCMQYELGIESTSFIQYGYWDSLKKGLMSGEKLQYDLRRLENAYLEENAREFEITKHISTAIINPLALLQLKETGSCDISLPEELFDLDFPGHYFRRIKTISVSIPCIAGPYTSVNATLRLQNSIYRKYTNGGSQYKHNTSEGLPTTDDRFVEFNNSSYAIATSSAQMDGGMFELNFRDERYLPFEGSGAVSTWRLELMEDAALHQFNYETISDVILHLKYTAREGGTEFKTAAVENVKSVIEAGMESGIPLSVLFDIKHEFADEWHKFTSPSGTEDTVQLDISVSKDRLPLFTANRNVETTNVSLFAKKKDLQEMSDIPFNTDKTMSFNASFKLFTAISDIPTSITEANDFIFSLIMDKTDVAKLDELYLLLSYTLS